MTRLIGGATGLLAALWVVFSPRANRRLYERYLFGTEGECHHDGAVGFADVENYAVSIPTAGGLQLRGWFFQHRASCKVILFCMGRNSWLQRRFDLVRLMLDSGASVLVFEYRGFGCSKAKRSFETLFQDAAAAYDYLGRRGYGPGDTLIYGESLGAAVAANLSTKRQSAGLILHSGFASLVRIGRYTVPLLRGYPAFMFPSERLDNTRIVSSCGRPLLIIHGLQDDTIPVEHSLLLHDAATEPKTLVHLPDADHLTMSDSDKSIYISALRRFIESLR